MSSTVDGYILPLMRLLTRPLRPHPTEIAFSSWARRGLYLALLAMSAWGGCATPHLRFTTIYFDMDGTALTSQGQIHPATVSALREFQQCGGHIGIASDHTFRQLRSYLPDMRPDLPLILYSGAVVVDPKTGREVEATPLPRAEMRSLIERLSALGGVKGVILHFLDRELLAKGDASDELHAFLTRADIQPSPIEKAADDPSLPAPIKILLYVKAARLHEIEAGARAIAPTGTRVVVTTPQTVELVAAQVNQGQTLVRVLKKRGISPEDVMAFGDSDNDVEMLQMAGAGIAMDRCTMRACDAAVLRAKSNDGDAIAQILRRFALTPKCKPRRPFY
jgi:Cof subfamily protein (haloacid dehalogenase superfamily)